jgi:N-acetylmuramoyl-L-alanine amidase
MRNKKCLILDPAHGKNVAGKRSPDGLHREYLWSRKRLVNIAFNLISIPDIQDYFDIHFPFLYTENEPGLNVRVKKYNEIAKSYDDTLMFSLHNDAFTNDWSEPHGIAVWTCRGQTKSDEVATDLYYHMNNYYPFEEFRKQTYKDGDPDYEANFAVLMGKYKAILLEFRFQTNFDDVKKLLNPEENRKFESVMIDFFTKYLTK